MNDSSSSNNPYLGPRSFEEGQHERFFGRSSEIRELTSLVIARRAVLLYAQSGAGKTSLIKAGLIPELRRREEIEIGILPIVRVFGQSGKGQGNPFVQAALTYLLPDSKDRYETLLAGLRPLMEQGDGDTPRLLIFDQMEELFANCPEWSDQRREFFQQLKECLDEFPQLTLLVSMREDYLASLLSWTHYLPDQMRTQMRLERLKFASAVAAVRGPAKLLGKPFEKDVAEQLVNNLRRIQTGARSADAPVEGAPRLGEFVEPVQLQIVCWRLWEKLPENASAITTADVERHADVDEVLKSFYEGALTAAHKESGVSERRMRQWFGKNLITPARTRGLVYRGPHDTGGLPNAAADSLEKSYLIRDERGGGEWYQLTHDRLVEPILQSNLDNRWAAMKRQTRLAYWMGLVLLLCCVAMLLASAFGNYKLTNTVRQAEKVANETLPSLDSIERLDTLRQALAQLKVNQRDQPPWRLRFMYAGNRLLPEAREKYFTAFARLLFNDTQSQMLALLRSLPAAPDELFEYGGTYDLLKAYLMTTSNPDNSTVPFLSPILLSRSQIGRNNVDPRLLGLVKTQFDFYCSELKEKNPYSSVNDLAAIAHARSYLAAFNGSLRLYQLMLADAVKQTQPVNFKSAETVLDSFVVPGPFTKAGWDFMKNDTNPDSGAERWVTENPAVPSLPPDLSQVMEMYHNDFIRHWTRFIATAHVPPYKNLADASKQLESLSGSGSPLTALFAVVAQNTAVDDPEVAGIFHPVQQIVSPGNKDYSDYLNALQALQTSLEYDSQRGATLAAMKLTDTLDAHSPISRPLEDLLFAPINNVDTLIMPKH